MMFFRVQFLLGLLVLSFPPLDLKASSVPGDSISLLIHHGIQAGWNEYRIIRERWERNNADLDSRANLLRDLEAGFSRGEIPSESELFRLILAREKHESRVEEIEMDLLKLRYRKGIDFIKLLYEKILTLEHHFVTVQTLQNIQLVSNPNNYDEFKKVEELIGTRLGKKQGIQLPELFASNPYASLVSTILGSFMGQGTREEREFELEKVACILDFTVQMHSDLKLIYFETEYLRSNTVSLKNLCQETFREYLAPLQYILSLDSCRNGDHWDEVDRNISGFFSNLSDTTGLYREGIHAGRFNMKADLEFSINRLYNFIQNYTEFIQQGRHYYNKFVIILHSYQNEQQCLEQLPAMLFQLQKDIEAAQIKYTTAYYIKELEGSRLKELLFGRIY